MGDCGHRMPWRRKSQERRLSKLDIVRFISLLLFPFGTVRSTRSIIISRIEAPDCRSRSEHTLSDANSVYELDAMDDSLKLKTRLRNSENRQHIKLPHAKSNVVACDNRCISPDESNDGCSWENSRHLRPNQLSRWQESSPSIVQPSSFSCMRQLISSSPMTYPVSGWGGCYVIHVIHRELLSSTSYSP